MRRAVRHERRAGERRRHVLEEAGGKAIAFRYAIFGHSCRDARRERRRRRGRRQLPRHVGTWTDAQFTNDGGGPGVCADATECRRQVEAGTFMHEMGHTFRLGHGGRYVAPADDGNYKPNYLSVMNYSFQLRNLIPGRKLDYSRWKLASLNETALLETRGIDNNAPPAGLSGWGKTLFTYYHAGLDMCTGR